MIKKIPLHDDDLLFLDVLPELHPDFIEKMRKSRQMFPHPNIKTMKKSLNKQISQNHFESQRNHEGKTRGPP
jgi:hypothetical protein